MAGMPRHLKQVAFFDNGRLDVDDRFAWQELGFWHIGRSQVMTGKYGNEEYWHNDLANSLRTNHLDITLQPVYQSFPVSGLNNHVFAGQGLREAPVVAPVWEPVLGLERLQEYPEYGAASQGHEYLAEEIQPAPEIRVVDVEPVEDEPDWLGRLEFTDDEPAAPVEPPAKKQATAKVAGRRGKAIGGSLLKEDGTSEASMVGML
jgi:hypothetical protein